MKRLKDFLGASIPLALGAVFLGAARQLTKKIVN